jgi:hypothetical protein
MGNEWQPLRQQLDACLSSSPAADSPSELASARRQQGHRVTLEAEVPEVLFRGMRSFLENHPHWDQYSLITYALAGFLFQNGCQDRNVASQYLDGLFEKP